MRYYGCKNRLLDFLEMGVAKTGINHGANFCDLFSGTTTVARYFKEKGYTVIANDIRGKSARMSQKVDEELC